LLAWSTPFVDPISLLGGGELVTLKGAGEYIQSLLEAKQTTAPWQAATEELLVVVNRTGRRCSRGSE